MFFWGAGDSELNIEIEILRIGVIPEDGRPMGNGEMGKGRGKEVGSVKGRLEGKINNPTK